MTDGGILAKNKLMLVQSTEKCKLNKKNANEVFPYIYNNFQDCLVMGSVHGVFEDDRVLLSNVLFAAYCEVN